MVWVSRWSHVPGDREIRPRKSVHAAVLIDMQHFLLKVAIIVVKWRGHSPVLWGKTTTFRYFGMMIMMCQLSFHLKMINYFQMWMSHRHDDQRGLRTAVRICPALTAATLCTWPEHGQHEVGTGKGVTWMSPKFWKLLSTPISYQFGGWATPLKNMKISWDDYSQYMEKQIAKPPASYIIYIYIYIYSIYSPG